MSSKLYFNIRGSQVAIMGRVEKDGAIGDIRQLLSSDDPMPVDGLTFDELKAADYGVINLADDGSYTIGPIEVPAA